MRRERARRPARFSGKRQRPCAWSRTLEDERKRIALGLRNPPRRPKQVARSSAAEGRCSNDQEGTSRIGPAIRGLARQFDEKRQLRCIDTTNTIRLFSAHSCSQPGPSQLCNQVGNMVAPARRWRGAQQTENAPPENTGGAHVKSPN
jgi:hypothetical protein